MEIKVVQADPKQKIAVPANPDLGVTDKPVSTSGALQGNQPVNMQGTSPAIQSAVGISGGQQPSLQGGSGVSILQPAGFQGQITNLSSTYGRDPATGLITNKLTGREFRKPEEFFAESGHKSFDGLQFDEKYKKPVSPGVNQFQQDLYSKLSGYSEDQLNDIGLVRTAAQDVTRASQGSFLKPDAYSSLIPANAGDADKAGLQSLIDIFKGYSGASFNSTSSGSSLVDTYNQLRESQGLNTINKQMVDLETIINGSENDIKAELQKSGALVTDSGVKFLATQRNKELLKQYDRLQSMRKSIDDYVNKAVELTGQDKDTARQKVMDAFGMQSTIFQLSQALSKTQVEQFAAARDFAVSNSVKKPFYSVGGTVYSSSSGLPARNLQEYIAMGGTGDYSDVQQIKSTGNLKEFKKADGTSAFWDPSTGGVYDPTGLSSSQTGAAVGTIFGLPAFDTAIANPGKNRPTRNNNPGNIKASEFSIKMPGVVGVEANPSTDGGNFLVFSSPQAGLNAIGSLLQNGSSYKGVTAEQAIKKYSGGGYGAADVGLNPSQNFQEQIKDSAALQSVVNSIAVREGYSPGTTSMSDAKYIAKAIMNGNQPPVLTGLYGKSAQVRAELEKNGFDLYGAQQDWTAAQRWITTMNSSQMIRYRGLADSVVNTIDEVSNLANELKLGGITALNKAELETYRNAFGNTPKGQLVSRYLGAVNTLKEEFANLAQGGYAPTEAAWALANSQINANYGRDQLNASLEEVKRLINYRLEGLKSQTPITPGQSSSEGSASGYLESIGVGSSNTPADFYLDTLNIIY